MTPDDPTPGRSRAGDVGGYSASLLTKVSAYAEDVRQTQLLLSRALTDVTSASDLPAALQQLQTSLSRVRMPGFSGDHPLAAWLNAVTGWVSERRNGKNRTLSEHLSDPKLLVAQSVRTNPHLSAIEQQLDAKPVVATLRSQGHPDSVGAKGFIDSENAAKGSKRLGTVLVASMIVSMLLGVSAFLIVLQSLVTDTSSGLRGFALDAVLLVAIGAGMYYLLDVSFTHYSREKTLESLALVGSRTSAAIVGVGVLYLACALVLLPVLGIVRPILPGVSALASHFRGDAGTSQSGPKSSGQNSPAPTPVVSPSLSDANGQLRYSRATGCQQDGLTLQVARLSPVSDRAPCLFFFVSDQPRATNALTVQFDDASNPRRDEHWGIFFRFNLSTGAEVEYDVLAVTGSSRVNSSGDRTVIGDGSGKQLEVWTRRNGTLDSVINSWSTQGQAWSGPMILSVVVSSASDTAACPLSRRPCLQLAAQADPDGPAGSVPILGPASYGLSSMGIVLDAAPGVTKTISRASSENVRLRTTTSTGN